MYYKTLHSKALLKTGQALILLIGFNIAMGHLQGLADFNMSKSGHQSTDQTEEGSEGDL